MKKLVYISLLSLASLFATSEVNAGGAFSPGTWEKDNKTDNHSRQEEFYDKEASARDPFSPGTWGRNGGDDSSQDAEPQE